MRLERRRPRLHECEARKGLSDVESAKFDAAEATAFAGGDARVPVASAIRAARVQIASAIRAAAIYLTTSLTT